MREKDLDHRPPGGVTCPTCGAFEDASVSKAAIDEVTPVYTSGIVCAVDSTANFVQSYHGRIFYAPS